MLILALYFLNILRPGMNLKYQHVCSVSVVCFQLNDILQTTDFRLTSPCKESPTVLVASYQYKHGHVLMQGNGSTESIIDVYLTAARTNE